LPHFQKLYDKLKDRTDIVALTFNVDDNVGLIEPFLKQNKYTFPVLPAMFVVDKMIPTIGVPRNWIVDPDGVVRQEQVGFGSADRWVEMMLEALEKAAKKGG